jgi:hypothetical protein
MNPFVLTGLGLLVPLAYTVGPRCVAYYMKMSLFYCSLLVTIFN